jgi:hypothetical protein
MEGKGGVEAHIYSYRTQRWPRKSESAVEFAVEFVGRELGCQWSLSAALLNPQYPARGDLGPLVAADSEPNGSHLQTIMDMRARARSQIGLVWRDPSA